MHRLLVDPEEDVARLDAGAARRRAVGDDARPRRRCRCATQRTPSSISVQPRTRDVQHGQDDEANDHGELSHEPQRARLCSRASGVVASTQRSPLLQSKGRSLSNVDRSAINHCPAITSMLERRLGFQQSGHAIQKPGGRKNRQKKAGHVKTRLAGACDIEPVSSATARRRSSDAQKRTRKPPTTRLGGRTTSSSS